MRWAPGTATERLEIAGELAIAAAAAGETELVLEAHLSRLVALLELGDPSFALQLATFTRLAEQAAIPRYLYLARSRQATSASLTGPLEAADELIESAAAYGERIAGPRRGSAGSFLAGHGDHDGGNVFRRDGDVWTVAFNGRTVPLRDAKGLRDLAVLLAAPGWEVAVTDLAAGVPGGQAPAVAALGADPILDDRARAAYRARLAELDGELAEADAHHDIERSARCRRA